MKLPALTLLLLLALAAAAVPALSSRALHETTTPAVPAAAATNSTHGRPNPALGCGFLWLNPCSTQSVTAHCRCKPSCRLDASFNRGTDTSGSSYCNNSAYNRGQLCLVTRTLKFDAKFTFVIDTRKGYTVNGRRYKPDGFNSNTVRITSC